MNNCANRTIGREEPGAEHGATLVECVFVFPLIILLAISSIDMLRFAYTAITLQFVTEAAMRNIAISNPTLSEGENFVITSAKSFGLSISAAQIELCPLNLPLPPDGVPKCPVDSIGAPGDMMMLRVRQPFRGLIMGQRFLRSVDFQASSLVMAKRELS